MASIEELENKISDLEDKIEELERDKIGWGEILAGIIGIIVFLKWGDNIWEFIKSAFFAIVGFVLNIFTH